MHEKTASDSTCQPRSTRDSCGGCRPGMCSPREMVLEGHRRLACSPQTQHGCACVLLASWVQPWTLQEYSLCSTSQHRGCPCSPTGTLTYARVCRHCRPQSASHASAHPTSTVGTQPMALRSLCTWQAQHVATAGMKACSGLHCTAQDTAAPPANNHLSLCRPDRARLASNSASVEAVNLCSSLHTEAPKAVAVHSQANAGRAVRVNASSAGTYQSRCQHVWSAGPSRPQGLCAAG